MGSRYTSFENFMQDVIRAAQTQASLKDIYGLNSNQIIPNVLAIIGLGWVVLVAIIPLLTLGWLGFLGAMAIFLLNPIGLLIAATFGVAAAAVLTTLHENKQFPLAVHTVGEHFREKYAEAVKQYSSDEFGKKEKIDALFDSAVLMLVLTPEEYFRQHGGD